MGHLIYVQGVQAGSSRPACCFPFSDDPAYDSGVANDTFAEAVYALVRQIPPGRVTTYGTLGQLLGRYRSARLVGWAMRHSPGGLPAHRVVNASGVLSGGWAFGHPSVQRALLEAEGVGFVGEARCNISVHYWPTADEADHLNVSTDP
jgi:methylated-DNA-protein-cysteine methyltransferase related protein